MSRSSWGEILWEGCGKYTFPATEGILPILSSLQSWNPLKTSNPEQATSTSHLPASLVLLSCPHWFPHSWNTGEDSPNYQGKRPPYGWEGRSKNTRLRVPTETLGNQPEGPSGDSVWLYPYQKKLPSLQPELNRPHNARRKDAPLPTKLQRPILETELGHPCWAGGQESRGVLVLQ